MTTETQEQDIAFENTTNKGEPDGLFRNCMKAIRSAHFKANRLRAGLVVAGLFTDKLIYREVLTLFYVVTKELELKLDLLKNEDEVCDKISSLGYHFTGQYESDMAALYSPETWRDEVEATAQKSAVTEEYRTKIKAMTKGSELAGAAFVLWGALIIGGGAAVLPRVEKLCGKEATHLFQDVAGPGRQQRRNKFISTWDTLAKTDTDEFKAIVEYTKQCMQLNNDIFTSLQSNPWWMFYASAGLVAALSMTVVYLTQRNTLLK
jgi:heme oxygenase